MIARRRALRFRACKAVKLRLRLAAVFREPRERLADTDHTVAGPHSRHRNWRLLLAIRPQRHFLKLFPWRVVGRPRMFAAAIINSDASKRLGVAFGPL